MINFGDATKENTKEHNQNWSLIILDHSYKISITGGSRSEKTNLLFNLINEELNIDEFIYMLKIYMKKNINFWLTKEKVQA